MITLSVNNKEFRDKLAKRYDTILERAERAVELTAIEAVKHAKSYSGTAPGSSVNSAGNYIPVSQRKERKAHPGGWSDISGNLVNSIRTGKVTITLGSVKADFGVLKDIQGSMEYAEILDQRDAIDVLGGAESAAQKALRKYAKEVIR